MQTKLNMYKNMNVIIERQSRLDKYVTGKTTLDSHYRNRGSWKYGSLKNLCKRQHSLFIKKNKLWNNEAILENSVKVGPSRNYFGSKSCEFSWEGIARFMYTPSEKFDVYVSCCYT